MPRRERVGEVIRVGFNAACAVILVVIALYIWVAAIRWAIKLAINV